MNDTVEYRGMTIEIKNDEHGFNPRTDCDNGGKLICFHRRYSLGDNHEFSNPDELQEFLDSGKVLASLPLYLYDHSGITMNTTGFSCRFDSGQVGVAYITQEGCDLIGYDESWRKANFSDKTMEEALEEVLRMEVKEYDKYISEGCFYYNIEETDDSCGGFLGSNHEESGLMEYAKNSIDCEINSRIKNKLEALKNYIKSSVPIIYRKLPSII